MWPFMKILLLLLLTVSLWGQYPEEYANLSEKIGMPTAIAMTAYNRPDYLQKTLEALARNPESQTLPFLFLLDGGPNAKQQELIEIIDSFHFPHCFIVAFPENLGCERNTVELKTFVFEHCGFKKVVVMEDDLLVPPWNRTASFECTSGQKRIFLDLESSPFVARSPVKEKKEKLLSLLTNPTRKALAPRKSTSKTQDPYWNMQDSPQNVTYYHTPPYWVYCMSRDVWSKIRNIQLEFLSLFIDRANPRYLNHPAVRHWMLKKLLEAKPLLDKAGRQFWEILTSSRWILGKMVFSISRYGHKGCVTLSPQ